MEIEEKWLSLLNLLIYDKRRNMSGMISRLEISRSFDRVLITYQAYMNHIYSNVTVFVEDFLRGNMVFLLPFAIDGRQEIFEKMAEMHESAIKEFFGEDFRDDMIVRISEEDRQIEIRRWDELVSGLKNWENYQLNKDHTQ